MSGGQKTISPRLRRSRSEVRASSRISCASASERRSFTYARCVLYGSMRGGGGGFSSSRLAGQPAARAVPLVGHRGLEREARRRAVAVGAPVRHFLPRCRLAALGLPHRPGTDPAAADR